MSKHKNKHATSNGPAAAEHEHSADVSRSASGQAEDVQNGRSADEERQRLIAVAAYYRAERRGFVPGCEMDDWLEAEAEVQQGRGSQSG